VLIETFVRCAKIQIKHGIYDDVSNIIFPEKEKHNIGVIEKLLVPSQTKILCIMQVKYEWLSMI